MPDSEAAVAALRTYREGGYCVDGLDHHYATVLAGPRLPPGVHHPCGYHAVALYHRPQRLCGCSDARAAGGGPRMAHQAPLFIYPAGPLPQPMSALPDGAGNWLQNPASRLVRAAFEAPWGVIYISVGGFPVDWLHWDQQRHITAHCIENVWTMTVLAHRSFHRVPPLWSAARDSAPPVGSLSSIP